MSTRTRILLGRNWNLAARICMAALILAALPVLAAPPSAEGPPQSVTYDTLVEYEGTYEYDNGSTLQIAASPADSILYALIAGAKYPLVPASAIDTFTNVAGERVVFTRDDKHNVSGYQLAGDGEVFRRLSLGGDYPRTMWYPRLAAQDPDYRYQYAAPTDGHDGVPVGSISGAGLDSARLYTMIEEIIGGKYPDQHSVLIAKSGRLVVEEYFYQYDAATPHQLRSVTKSFVSALVGIAIDQGLIESVENPVLPYFAGEYGSFQHITPAKERMTIEDLLTQRSGLACDDWDADSPGNEVEMGQSADWVKFVLDLPMTAEPGTETHYCSGAVIVLGRLVEKVAGVPLETFAEEHLFGPLGIKEYTWRFEPDSSSSETFSQMYLLPRDMLKFGLLFTNNGRWRGRQVISEEWVAKSTSSQATVGDTDYGFLWWRPYLNVSGKRHDAIAAQGNGGQEIYIWPELDLIVVLTGGRYNKASHTNRLLVDYIVPSAESSQ